MKNILIPLLVCSALFGQQNYNLGTHKYHDGMHIVGRTEISITTNSSDPEEKTINIVSNSETRIIGTDENGIALKFETTSSENGSNEESNGKKLVYEQRAGKYVLISMDGESPSESIMQSIGSIPCVGIQGMGIPAYPIPVGFEWELDVPSVLNTLVSTGVEIPPGIVQMFSGRFRYKFSKIVNNSYTITAKGKINIKGDGDIPPGKVSVNMVMMQDAQTGVVNVLDGSFSCSFSGGMRADGRVRSTQDIVP